METESFETADGTPVTAVTADEMRAVDRVAVEEVGIGLLQLMENAGHTLARQVREMGTDLVTVVAGTGGNGGGGLCCARHLANRNVPVTVVLDRPAADLGGAAAIQYNILESMGVPVNTGVEALRKDPGDLVVDALIGYGLDGAPRGTAADLVKTMNHTASPVLSLDVPSGRNATSGDASGVAVSPDRIVTLALPKTGLTAVTCPITLADISIPAVIYERLDIPYTLPFDDAYAVELRATGDKS